MSEAITPGATNRVPRFLKRNKITSGNISYEVFGGFKNYTPAHGIVTRPQKNGVGGASLNIEKRFTGLTEADFVIEVENASTTGMTIGSGTVRIGREFRDGSGFTWVATGVATVDGLSEFATTTSSSGLEFSFTPGKEQRSLVTGLTRTDFSPRDQWMVKARLPYGVERMLEEDRGTYFQTLAEIPSAGVPQILVFSVDLSGLDVADRNTNTFALLDHNFPAGSSVFHQYGATQDMYGVDSFNKKNIYYFTDTSFPLHSFAVVTLPDSPPASLNDFLQIGHLYLGEYFEFERHRDIEFVRATTVSSENSDIHFSPVDHVQDKYRLSFTLASDSQADQFLNEVALTTDQIPAFFVHFNPDIRTDTELNDFSLYFFDQTDFERISGRVGAPLSDFSLELTEIPREDLKQDGWRP